MLLVLCGVSLHLLLPSLLAVFESWRSLSHLDGPFALAGTVPFMTFVVERSVVRRLGRDAHAPVRAVTQR